MPTQEDLVLLLDQERWDGQPGKVLLHLPLNRRMVNDVDVHGSPQRGEILQQIVMRPFDVLTNIEAVNNFFFLKVIRVQRRHTV